MWRRDFITLLGGATAAGALPAGARAQRSAMPVIGYLSSASPPADTVRTAGFRKGLSETGFVEGQNVAVEYHWADGDYGRLPELAAAAAQSDRHKQMNACRARYRDCVKMNQIPSFECQYIYSDCLNHIY
jgi:hypothetical protein